LECENRIVGNKYKIRNKIWLYPGDTPWHFVYIGKKQSEEIKKKHGKNKRGFGSIPVEVTLGKTKWRTSIFPEKDGLYLLPLKAEVRKKERVADGDKITYTIEIK
jgi:hypothetical protein